jgi:hypothetical protein
MLLESLENLLHPEWIYVRYHEDLYFCMGFKFYKFFVYKIFTYFF